jgi:cytochrome c oxidase subunit III
VASHSLTPAAAQTEWVLPHRGPVAMLSLILAEASIFTIFVVAYIFYLGKSLSGPNPKDVLEMPIFASICLLSSSGTVHFAVAALRKGLTRLFAIWWFATLVLGAIFLGGTALEWRHLIYEKGLTISTNLFGTTYYSLVGLHASHVTIGLIILLIGTVCALLGKVKPEHHERADVFSLYWHFVDGVWVVVFTVVYVIGR